MTFVSVPPELVEPSEGVQKIEPIEPASPIPSTTFTTVNACSFPSLEHVYVSPAEGAFMSSV